MNAEEARTTAQLYSNKADDKQYDEIITGIKIAANRGDFLFGYADYVRANVRHRLIKDGYKVGYPSKAGPNEVVTEISWNQN